MIALAAAVRKKLVQMDVKFVCLYATFEDEKYVEILKAVVPGGEDFWVLELKRCSYGLKQGSRKWKLTINTKLYEMGF